MVVASSLLIKGPVLTLHLCGHQLVVVNLFYIDYLYKASLLYTNVHSKLIWIDENPIDLFEEFSAPKNAKESRHLVSQVFLLQ